MNKSYIFTSIFLASAVSLSACQSKSVNETASVDCTPESEDVAMMMGGMGMGMGTQGTMGGMGMGGQGTQGTMGGMGMGGMGMGMMGTTTSADASTDVDPAADAGATTDENVVVAQAPCSK